MMVLSRILLLVLRVVFLLTTWFQLLYFYVIEPQTFFTQPIEITVNVLLLFSQFLALSLCQYLSYRLTYLTWVDIKENLFQEVRNVFGFVMNKIIFLLPLILFEFVFAILLADHTPTVVGYIYIVIEIILFLYYLAAYQLILPLRDNKHLFSYMDVLVELPHSRREHLYSLLKIRFRTLLYWLWPFGIFKAENQSRIDTLELTATL